jgi:hypothetical protein
MKGPSVIQRLDLLARYAKLRRRTENLLMGVTPMPFYIGAYGLNTSWIDLTPMEGWHIVESGHIKCRIRSDVVYFNREGNLGGVTPASTGWPAGPVFQLPGKPHVFWPSSTVRSYFLTTVGGNAIITVKPNGRVYVSKPTSGRVLVPGAGSFPRG